MKKIYITAVVCGSLTLGGCSAIYNWFDGVGQHFPVIGQRCENWQCFTASGQEVSRERIIQQQGGGVRPNTPPCGPTVSPASGANPQAAQNTKPCVNAPAPTQGTNPPVPTPTPAQNAPQAALAPQTLPPPVASDEQLLQTLQPSSANAAPTAPTAPAAVVAPAAPTVAAMPTSMVHDSVIGSSPSANARSSSKNY